MTRTMTPDAPPDDDAGSDGFIWSRERIPPADPETLQNGIVNALLIMAGIVGAGGLLYFRAEFWAWATGDPVTFAVGLVMLAVGSVLAIRVGRERRL